MKTKTAVLTSIALFLATLGFIAASWSRLPAQLPTHWDVEGRVNGTMAPAGFLGFFICLTLLLGVLLWGLPKLSPKGFEVVTWRPIYDLIVLIVIGMMCAVHVAIVAGAIGVKFDMTRVVISLVLLGLGLMGNLLGKVRRNFWVGVRTPWTLASEAVWNSTHRLAARLMFGAGVVGAISVAAGAPTMIVFIGVMVVMLYPVVYSYLEYRRLNPN